MISRDLLQQTLNHREPERIVFDMDSTAVMGIHVKALENICNYYSLKKRYVRVIESYQMLGLVEDDLIQSIGIAVIGAWGHDNMFGYSNQPSLKLFKTFWGKEMLVSEKFSLQSNENGDLLSFPEGDTSIPTSAKMPVNGYFFDAIERQNPIDDENLNVDENLEEFVPVPDDILNYRKTEKDKAQATGKGFVVGLGGTALGDIALVPGMQLKQPKGIRSIAECYMSTIMRSDYIKDIFDQQSALAVENLQKIHQTVGSNIDVVFLCGTYFGTQDFTFCTSEQFDDLWLHYYQRINDWIHANTNWKTFKHLCGAVENFMGRFMDAGSTSSIPYR